MLIGTPPRSKFTDPARSLAEINQIMAEKQVAKRAHDQKLQFVKILHQPIAANLIEKIDLNLAQKALCLPFAQEGPIFKIAVAEPENPLVQKFLAQLSQQNLVPKIYLASGVDIHQRLRELTKKYLPTLPPETPEKPAAELASRAIETQKFQQLQKTLPRLSAKAALREIFAGALRLSASDLHFQFEETEFLIRIRVDGVLLNIFQFSKKFGQDLIMQLKYEAKLGLNISEIPQDGRLTLTLNQRSIDIRVATLPTIFGETIVCRLLDRGRRIPALAELGFQDQTLTNLQQAQKFTEGLILVTGPTGSGKTTTLYSLLNLLNSSTKKILTLEDPVEYHLAGIVQSQINPVQDFSFARGLRALLRQDPDILMVGEIRDNETAEVAANAALTGHTVLATLHTNSALDALARLRNLGLPNFVLAASLKLVLSQRLARKPCATCARNVPLTPAQQALFNKYQITPPKFLVTGSGCAECNQSGYHQRLALSESFLLEGNLRDLILQNAELIEFQKIFQKKGILSITLDGLKKVSQGTTNLAELTRVLGLQTTDPQN